MTRIELTTADQRLINPTRVTIAAGDMASVEVHVNFDSKWDNFPARSATFHTSNNATVHEMLLIDGTCIVPAEVLKEKGVLFIGVRGISANGEAVKTSSIVKYNIVSGATAGETTLNPPMDLYQQYLAAVNERIDPVIAAFMKKVEDAIRTEMETLRAIAEDNQPVVLWENPDPSAEFAATTIEMDLTEFKSFRVIYKYKKDGDDYYMERVFSQKGFTIAIRQIDSSFDYMRATTFSDNGITFDHGRNTYYAGDNSIRNNLLIPVLILGYKH